MTEASRICKICFESYDEFYHRPYEIFPCGHVFGDACVFELDIKECPICGSHFDLIVLPNLQTPLYKQQPAALPPIMSSRKKKTIYLFGHVGHGKSSLVNLLYGYQNDIVPTATSERDYHPEYSLTEDTFTQMRDTTITTTAGEEKKSESGGSFTKKSFIYGLSHPILGNIDVIDTPGLNGEQDTSILLKLALLLFNSNKDLRVDAIVYVLSAKADPNSIEADIETICKLFNIESKELINNYLITVCTNCNERTTSGSDDEATTSDETRTRGGSGDESFHRLEELICNKYRVPCIKWDNRRPFKSQLEKFKMNFDMVYPIELNFNVLNEQLKTISEYLREQDKDMVLTPTNLDLDKHEVKDITVCLRHSSDEQHQHDASHTAYTHYAVSKLFPILNDKYRKRLEPKYEAHAQIKRIKNIRNRIIREENVIDELLFAPKLSFEFDDDLSDCTIASEIYFYPEMRAKCYIEYEIKYDIEYEMPKSVDGSEFRYKDINLYKKKSIELFLSRLNDTKGGDATEKFTDPKVWDSIVAEIVK